MCVTLATNHAELVFLHAEKVAAHRYHIYHVTTEKDTKLVGTLEKVSSPMGSIAYLLKLGAEESACFFYDIFSFLKCSRSNPPRSLQVALCPHDATECMDERCETSILDACKASFSKSSTLREAQEEISYIHICKSKPPYRKDDGRLGLNFKGRGRIPSRKNMQLANDVDNENVVIQFAKWGETVFILDFKFPYNCFQAFGFAIAQIDL
jgi:hypothetical protein